MLGEALIRTGCPATPSIVESTRAALGGWVSRPTSRKVSGPGLPLTWKNGAGSESCGCARVVAEAHEDVLDPVAGGISSVELPCLIELLGVRVFGQAGRGALPQGQPDGVRSTCQVTASVGWAR